MTGAPTGEGQQGAGMPAAGSSSDSMNRRLGSSQRIAKSADFDAIFAEKRKFAGKYMVMWLGRPLATPALRLGVVTSKRTFRRSVDRSRARRLLRESFRLNRFKLKPEVDVVLLGRYKLLSARRQDVDEDLLKLADKAGILLRD